MFVRFLDYIMICINKQLARLHGMTRFYLWPRVQCRHELNIVHRFIRAMSVLTLRAAARAGCTLILQKPIPNKFILYSRQNVCVPVPELHTRFAVVYVYSYSKQLILIIIIGRTVNIALHLCACHRSVCVRRPTLKEIRSIDFIFV